MNWITLTEPQRLDHEVDERPAPAVCFHLRADIITEIVPGLGETIVRTSTGGQYVCAETADHVIMMLAPNHEKLMR